MADGEGPVAAEHDDVVLLEPLGEQVGDLLGPGRELGVHDYAGIVWDEVVGYLLTLFLVPLTVHWMIIGFLLFRLFDIGKPGPIRRVDKHVTGGLGIMLDDVLAAIPAWVCLQLLVAWYGQ